jgi:hypothetical protein
MQLKDVFEIVRNEQAVLWIGSGFSLYAGYPSGKQLSEILYNNLSKNEQGQVSINSSLIDLSEEFIRIKGNDRKVLNYILEKEFIKSPKEIKWHRILSQIPHIHTIITTNYDNLFENVYKDNIQVILSSKDLADLGNSKVELFKVHGDIRNLETVIIAKRDYNNFMGNRTSDSLVWSVIKERISSKHVIFIGYDLEDQNIEIVFQHIRDSLGDNIKKMCLIAPNQKAHKVNYLKQMGIEYLDFKGEVFIEKLYENIKDRITDDFSNGHVSAETLRTFYNNNNLQFKIASDNNKYNLSEIKSSSNPLASLKIKFKNDSDSIESFKSIVQGRRFGKSVIDGSSLEQLKVLLNDINIVDDNLDRYRIVVNSKPRREGIANVIFEDKSEFEDINYELFNSKELMEIVVRYKNVQIVVQVGGDSIRKENESVSGTITHELLSEFKNTNEAILATEFSIKIGQGLPATIYFGNSTQGETFQLGSISLPMEKLKHNLDFFESLKKVEKLYNVRFTNFKDYTSDDYSNVKEAILSASEEVHIQDWSGELVWDLNKDSSIVAIMKGGTRMTAESQEREVVEIFGTKITLGYKHIEPLDLYIVNLKEVHSGQTSSVITKSRSKQVSIFYKHFIDKG